MIERKFEVVKGVWAKMVWRDDEPAVTWDPNPPEHWTRQMRSIYFAELAEFTSDVLEAKAIELAGGRH